MSSGHGMCVVHSSVSHDMLCTHEHNSGMPLNTGSCTLCILVDFSCRHCVRAKLFSTARCMCVELMACLSQLTACPSTTKQRTSSLVNDDLVDRALCAALCRSTNSILLHLNAALAVSAGCAVGWRSTVNAQQDRLPASYWRPPSVSSSSTISHNT